MSSFSDLLRSLNENIAWLERHGINVPKGSRFRLYQDRLADLATNYSSPTWPADDDIGDRTYNALEEACDLDVVRAAFPDISKVPGLAGKLREVVEGPERYFDEDIGGGQVQPRSSGFEMTTAAYLQLAGFAPSVNQRADAVFMLGDQRVQTECKKVRHVDAVPIRLEEARRKTLADLGGVPRDLNSMLIAIDVSRVVVDQLLKTGLPTIGDRKGFPVFRIPHRMLEEALAVMAQEIGRELAQDMASKWHERILAVAGRYCLSIESGGSLIHVRRWVFIPNDNLSDIRKATCLELAAALAKTVQAA